MKKLILIASVILLKSIGFSQDTITTIPVFTSNNGYDAISFEVVATSSINITSISNWWSNGTNTTDIWIKQGPINGTGTLVVNNSNGWYLHQSGVTVNGANTNGPASWVSGMNPINVAAGNTIGIVLTGSMRYFTATTAPITTFTGAFAQINAGSPSNGFGGQIPNLGNNPRGFLGSIVLELDLIGNCANPFTNVITDNILATTAQINWTPGATNTSFWLEYGLAGFTPGTGTMISGTYPGAQPPINLTGLAVNSNYDYYVGEICNSGNDSIYSVSPYEFTTTRLCAPATNLAVTSILSTSADISWNHPGGANSFTINYGAGLSQTATSSPYTLTGLSPLSSYDIYVQADCGNVNGLSDSLGPISFTTPCGVLLPPQLEDFSGGFLPNSCWEQAGDGTPATGPSGLGTSSWFNDGFGNVGFTGAVKVNLYTTGKNEWAITPQYDLSIGGRFQVEFDFGVFDWPTTTPGTLGSDDRVELLISRNGGTSWSSLVNYNNSYVTAPGGNHEIIPLPNDSGIVQFAIWATEGSVDDLEDNDVMFDNFEVASVPCQQPAALGTSNITASSADLTWTSVGNETAWGIQYGSSGFTLGTGNTDSVSSNPYSLTGLSGSSTYDLYVKAICAPGSSSWTGPFTFTTSCAPGTFQQSISSCNTYLWNGNNYDSSGIYIDSLQTNNGCDSIVTLVLTINNDTITQDVKVSCDSVFIWNGTPLNSSGQYIDTLQSINGCDSIVKLNITLNYTPSSLTTQAICDGDSLKFGSSVYSITGLYTDTLQSWIGCDSTSTLDLLVTNITVSLDTSQLSLVANISGGTGPFNYNWSDGSTSSTLITDSSGLYTLVITDASGCISNTASYNVIFNTTGAISNTKDQLIIYPNPNNGQFIITNSEPINEIFISDLQGKNVYSNKNLNVNKLDIEVNNLEKGMYLVNIVTINGMNIKTVIIH